MSDIDTLLGLGPFPTARSRLIDEYIGVATQIGFALTLPQGMTSYQFRICDVTEQAETMLVRLIEREDVRQRCHTCGILTGRCEGDSLQSSEGMPLCCECFSEEELDEWTH